MIHKILYRVYEVTFFAVVFGLLFLAGVAYEKTNERINELVDSIESFASSMTRLTK